MAEVAGGEEAEVTQGEAHPDVEERHAYQSADDETDQSADDRPDCPQQEAARRQAEGRPCDAHHKER